MPHPVDLAAEDGREVARVATRDGLLAMPTLAEIYPVGGERGRGDIFPSRSVLPSHPHPKIRPSSIIHIKVEQLRVILDPPLGPGLLPVLSWIHLKGLGCSQCYLGSTFRAWVAPSVILDPP